MRAESCRALQRVENSSKCLGRDWAKGGPSEHLHNACLQAYLFDRNRKHGACACREPSCTVLWALARRLHHNGENISLGTLATAWGGAVATDDGASWTGQVTFYEGHARSTSLHTWHPGHDALLHSHVQVAPAAAICLGGLGVLQISNARSHIGRSRRYSGRYTSMPQSHDTSNCERCLDGITGHFRDGTFLCIRISVSRCTAAMQRNLQWRAQGYIPSSDGSEVDECRLNAFGDDAPPPHMLLRSGVRGLPLWSCFLRRVA